LNPLGLFLRTSIPFILRILNPWLRQTTCFSQVDLAKRPGALEAIAEELGGMHIEFFGHVKVRLNEGAGSARGMYGYCV
jgi:hypothetical protein